MKERQGYEWLAYIFWGIGLSFTILEISHLAVHLFGGHSHHEFAWILGPERVLGITTVACLVGVFFARGAPGTAADRVVDWIIDSLPSWGRKGD